MTNNRFFYDEEAEQHISLNQLQEEYTELKASNDTEAETFNDYLQNCLEGTLIEL